MDKKEWLFYFFISLFQVASRRVVLIGGILMTIFGTLTKFGAIFVTVPEPIVGALFFSLFGELVERHVDAVIVQSIGAVNITAI